MHGLKWIFGCLSLLLVFTYAPRGEAYARVSVPAAKSPTPRNASHSKSPTKRDLAFDLNLLGGTLLPWETPEETGNAVGCTASLRWSDFRAGLAYGAVLPDSRSQGLYHSVWAEFAWFFMGTIGSSHVSPYVVTGLGVALPDSPPEVRLGDPETVRWNEEATFLGMLGLGVRYGLDRGLYVALDVRAYNHTFGGLTVSAGVTF
jgi:hypothetical protein